MTKRTLPENRIIPARMNDSSSKADDNGDFSSEVIDEDNSHIKDSAENTSGTEKS